MIRKLLVLLPLLVLSGCDEDGVYVAGSDGNSYKVIVIDRCEYIKITVSGGVTLCHKGNCANSIHAYRVEKSN